MDLYERFAENVLGVTFNDINLLVVALTHKSYEHGSFENYERLEFLGDSILDYIVSTYLYEEFPNNEGDLTKWRSALVCESTLASVAKELGIDSLIRITSMKTPTISIIADCYESVLAAIKLDQGFEACSEFVHLTLISRLHDIINKKLEIDPISKLNEHFNSTTHKPPIFRVISKTSIKNNATLFTVGIYSEKQLLCTGRGTNKSLARHDAAKKAIEKLGI